MCPLTVPGRMPGRYRQQLVLCWLTCAASSQGIHSPVPWGWGAVWCGTQNTGPGFSWLWLRLWLISYWVCECGQVGFPLKPPTPLTVGEKRCWWEKMPRYSVWQCCDEFLIFILSQPKYNPWAVEVHIWEKSPGRLWIRIRCAIITWSPSLG